MKLMQACHVTVVAGLAAHLATDSGSSDSQSLPFKRPRTHTVHGYSVGKLVATTTTTNTEDKQDEICVRVRSPRKVELSDGIRVMRRISKQNSHMHDVDTPYIAYRHYSVVNL